MKELKILGLVAAFTLILYIGIEPFAHKFLHPHVAPANFNVQQGDEELANERIATAKKGVEEAEKEQDVAAKKDIEKEESELASYNELWERANAISALTGNAQKGEELFVMACTSCHGLKTQGFDAPFDDELSSEAYGVVVPDLSSAGAIYDEKFLIALIENPSLALKLSHKFNDDNPFPMTPFYGIEDDIEQEVADIVAYLKSIAPSEISGKEIFSDACLRCHDMKYDKLLSPGDKAHLTSYMGMTPPDLSMMIRSRSAYYLNTFINDPQKNLPGTSMPRVGLTENAQEQVIQYMEEVGDSKKSERTTVGIVLILFFTAMSVVAYFWKKEVWKDLH